MKLTNAFKKEVASALLISRENYGGSDAAFAKTIDISPSIFSRLRKGETDKIMSEQKWLSIGRSLDVTLRKTNWKVARTSIYNEIEQNLVFCQTFSKAMILVDECGIGKTFCSKQISKKMNNAFYFDCSQAKTKSQFIRKLAKTLGVDNRGRYVDVKDDLKYYLNLLETPLVILDDAGYLEYSALLEIQELWNATEGHCGWYMIGDDSLQAKIDKGLNSKKVGYKALFSRFSDEYVSIVPRAKHDKQDFYSQLIGDVANVNVSDKTLISKMIKKCIAEEKTLRNLSTLIQMNA